MISPGKSFNTNVSIVNRSARIEPYPRNCFGLTQHAALSPVSISQFSCRLRAAINVPVGNWRARCVEKVIRHLPSEVNEDAYVNLLAFRLYFFPDVIKERF